MSPFLKGPSNSPVSRQPRQQQTKTVSKAVCPKSRWSSKMLDCCDDKLVCLCGCLFGPLLACQLATRYGECCCQPMLPGGLAMLRASMRQRYNIEGSILDDAAVVCTFGPCALCQMAREYKSHSRKM
ncbi:hypothetical protein ACEWY4_019990 [Coilia grayii]|uniref:Cornifelin n=1 Tax=Coilia grayii TaxID=363190 RepID=A0ABD1JBB8_9TELE